MYAIFNEVSKKKWLKHSLFNFIKRRMSSKVYVTANATEIHN